MIESTYPYLLFIPTASEEKSGLAGVYLSPNDRQAEAVS
jgi:hypothetical protein